MNLFYYIDKYPNEFKLTKSHLLKARQKLQYDLDIELNNDSKDIIKNHYQRIKFYIKKNKYFKKHGKYIEDYAGYKETISAMLEEKRFFKKNKKKCIRFINKFKKILEIYNKNNNINKLNK